MGRSGRSPGPVASLRLARSHEGVISLGHRGRPRRSACHRRRMRRRRSPITEAEQVKRANAAGRVPVVFVHGLWLLPSSWDRWAERLRGERLHGVDTGLAGRPRDGRRGQRAPRGVRQQVRRARWRITSRRSSAGSTRSRPSSGTRSAGSSPRSSRVAGERRCRWRSIRRRSAACCRCRSRRCESASPVLRNPANRNRAVPLTYEQFRYAFANAVSEEEAKELLRDLRRGSARRSRSSRPRPPTSTRGRRSRSTPRTPSEARS